MPTEKKIPINFQLKVNSEKLRLEDSSIDNELEKAMNDANLMYAFLACGTNIVLDCKYHILHHYQMLLNTYVTIKVDDIDAFKDKYKEDKSFQLKELTYWFDCYLTELTKRLNECVQLTKIGKLPSCEIMFKNGQGYVPFDARNIEKMSDVVSTTVEFYNDYRTASCLGEILVDAFNL